MTDHHTHQVTGDNPGRRHRADGIIRAATAAAAGLAAGWASRDIGTGLTTASIALELLREAFVRPRQ